MRLNSIQLNTICTTAEEFFGPSVRVWLFGSRIDNKKKGGDIDLYIESDIQEAPLLVDAKFNFLRALHRLLGDQKIDVVLHRFNANLLIYDVAKETGVRIR